MRERDDWDDDRGAEAYAETVAKTYLYRALGGRLIEFLAPAPGDRVLDLATGTGLLCGMLYVRSRAAIQLVGVDRAAAMLDVARRNLPVRGIAFVRCDPAALPFAGGGFDACCCSAALWHFPALLGCFESLARVLRPGGRLAFNVPAAQIEDLDDAPPSPLQQALAGHGERRFGGLPSAAGPTTSRRALLQLSTEAGLVRARAETFDLIVPQRDLIELLSVPAISARMYPDVDEAARDRWIADAAASVDPDEIVPVRWWQGLFERRETSSAPS